MAKELKLTKKDRISVWLRSTFLQGSWNYERMQNGGWAFAMIPAIKRLYKTKEERSAALKRHLEFFNTHPYVASPILGVTLALEEERSNGTEVDDITIQGVKVGMMGPLAGIGDPVFWFTVRPILGALGASLAINGNILGPIIFFVAWNLIRMAFTWYTQEFGYKVGSSITDDLSGGLLQDITRGASILGMFILGALVNRWVSVSFAPTIKFFIIATSLSTYTGISSPTGPAKPTSAFVICLTINGSASSKSSTQPTRFLSLTSFTSLSPLTIAATYLSSALYIIVFAKL